MSLIVDGVLLLIAAVVIGIHVKRGAVRSLFGLLSVVVAGIAAYLFGPTVGTVLFAPLLGGAEETMQELLLSVLSSAEGSVDMDTLFGQLPPAFRAVEDTVRAGLGSVAAVTAENVPQIAAQMAAPVVTSVSRTLGSVAVFAAVSIVMFVLKRVLFPVMRLPILKQADKLVGLLLGILIAFVYVWVLCLVARALVDFRLLRNVQPLADALDTSAVYAFFCSLM